MPRRPRATGASDIPVLIWGGVIGLLGTAGYAGWRAASEEAANAGERLGTFGLNLAWPGVLIFAAIVGAIWFGWKLNLD
jgi:hypothetical protein